MALVNPHGGGALKPLLLQGEALKAELYALRGQLVAAIQQLELAQKAGDGDFFEHSQVDARLRELRARQQEEARQKMPL